MKDRALFLSWCPLSLLRPRAIQVGRTAKAVQAAGWEVELVSASLQLAPEDDLLDTDLAHLYAGCFKRVAMVPDPDFGQREAESARKPRPFARWRPRKPAGSVPWVDAAATSAGRWLKQRKAPLLVSFGQPWVSHLSALKGKRLLPRIGWIAHFSDPWAANPYSQVNGADLESMRADERLVVEGADALVFVTRQTADLVMGRYPERLQAKVHIIPHMMDMDLAAGIQPWPRRDHALRIVHVGSLYEGRRAPGGLIGGLVAVKQAGFTPAQLEIRFVGDLPPSYAADLERAGVAGYVHATPPLYYGPSLREMAAADVLLAIDAVFDTNPFLPSKIIDYLMFDRPMAALTPPGSATQELMRTLHYPTAEPGDPGAVASMIMDLLQRWRSGGAVASDAHRVLRAQFDMSAVGMAYDGLFRRVLERRAAT